MKAEITLRVRCLMPERLVARALERGARLASVARPDDRTLVIECDAASARIVLALCERFALPAKVLRRRGGTALARFARRRRTLPIGIALALALSAMFLGRIWRVDIAFSGEAAELGDRAALMESIAAAGIRPGVTRHVDTALLAQRLQAESDRYSFIGVKRQGVRLLVEAVPEIPAPGVYDVEAPRDLVCSREGIVVRAVARSGELCVKPGDAVRRGQLLIRGEEQATKEETRPIAALGEVIVRAWYAGGAALATTRPVIRETGRVSVGSRLSALGHEWPIVPCEAFASQRVETEALPVGGLFLPVQIERVTCRETRVESVDRDEAALKDALGALAYADAALRLWREGPRDCEIADRWIRYDHSDGALRAQAVYEIHADAAVTREALRQGG